MEDWDGDGKLSPAAARTSHAQARIACVWSSADRVRRPLLWVWVWVTGAVPASWVGWRRDIRVGPRR